MLSREERFFQAYEAAFSPLHDVYTNSTPREMMAGPVEPGGWFPWKMLPGDRPLDDVFIRYEEASGMQMPPSFRRWYESKYTLDMDCAVIRLPANPFGSAGKGLLDKIILDNPYWERPLSFGLLPFADEALMDAGCICFDTNSHKDPDQWAIRYWDHDWIGHDQEVSEIIFSNFAGLLDAVTVFLEKHEEPRSKRMQALVAADPLGAGGPGREYWMSFAEDF